MLTTETKVTPMNFLLSQVAATELRQLLTRSQQITFKTREVLYEACEPLDHVFFPAAGVLTLTNATRSGSAIEITSVGRHHAAGIEVVLGERKTIDRCIGLLPGQATRVDASLLQQVFHSDPVFRNLMLRYVGERLRETAQLLVCNRLHSVEERLARWLLIIADRGETRNITVTHDEVSQLLGVRRSTITLTTGAFQQQNLIRYRRGHMELIDCDGLQRRSCECYPLLRHQSSAGIAAE